MRRLRALLLLLPLAVWPLSGQTPIVANPTKLSFVFQTGKTFPPPQNIEVSAPGGQLINVSRSAEANWLFLSTPQATAPFTLSVSVAPTVAGAGSHSATITLSRADAPSISTTITVSLVVSDSVLLSVNRAILNFTHSLNAPAPSPQSLTLGLTDPASSALTVTANSTTDSGGLWLQVSPTATAPGSLSVSVDVTGLSPATYTGRITLSATGAANSPVTVDVVLVVGAEVALAVNPSSLSFVFEAGGEVPPNQGLMVVSSTGQPIPFTVSVSVQGDQQWLTVTPPSASTPASVSVGVTPAGLANGTYQGTVTVQGPGSPVAVAVTLLVTDQPVLRTDPAALSFVHQTGAGTPAPQLLVVSNRGAGLAVSASVEMDGGGSWLAVAPAAWTTPAAAIVSVNPSGLGAGDYSGRVVLTAQGAGNSPLRVPVRLSVRAAPLLVISHSSVSFHHTTGAAAPAAKTVAVSSTGAAVSFTVSTAATGASGWLMATQSAQSTPANVNISVNPSGLEAGIYQGTVTITPAQEGGVARTIAVTLRVAASAMLEVSPAPLRFHFVRGTAEPPKQNLLVASSGAAFNYTATAFTMSGGSNWIVLAPSAGTTGQAIEVGVSTNLADGVYSGLITVAASGIVNSPRYVPVLFTVTSESQLRVRPNSLSFRHVIGGMPPASQKLTIESVGAAGPLAVRVTASTQIPGQTWLSVRQTDGLTPLEVDVQVNPAGLAAGTYFGFVTVGTVGPGLPQSFTVPVSLEVLAQTIPINPGLASLTFSYTIGGPAPQPQSVPLSAASPLGFTASTTTASGGSWLSVTPASGTTPATLTVSVNIAGLTAATYTGQVVVESSGATNSPLRIPVTLTVTAAPISLVSIKNAASFLPTQPAPGLIVTLEGTGLGPAVGAVGQVVGGRLARQLSGVRVLFDGVAAPLLYVSGAQINAVVPYEIVGAISTRIEVEYQGVRSNMLERRVDATSPGIFTLSSTGTGPGAILNEDYSVNTAGNAAARGSAIIIYGTGEGQTNPGGDTGLVIGELVKRPRADVRVRIGGQEATVLYAGSAPGFVSGALQVNALVPAGITPGTAVPIELIIGGVSSQAGVTVAVR